MAPPKVPRSGTELRVHGWPAGAPQLRGARAASAGRAARKRERTAL